MNYVHDELAAGRWFALSLAQQMGNIGSEISRTLKWQNKDSEISTRAAFRALELLDLTISDPRWKIGLKELTRVREIFCDTFFGENQYNTTLLDLDKYFTKFALASRLDI